VRVRVGALLMFLAAIGLALGGLWAFMKASGAEVDVCTGRSCTSGWYYAGPILAGAVVAGAIGIALLRRGAAPRARD
jgi:hypothetical protein